MIVMVQLSVPGWVHFIGASPAIVYGTHALVYSYGWGLVCKAVHPICDGSTLPARLPRELHLMSYQTALGCENRWPGCRAVPWTQCNTPLHSVCQHDMVLIRSTENAGDKTKNVAGYLDLAGKA